MAKSRTGNNKSKKSKVPMWAVAAIVVVVVAVAGYAIIRFSQASEQAGKRRYVRAAGSPEFSCPTALSGKSYGFSASKVCVVANGQHATGIWENFGSTGINFGSSFNSGIFGANSKGYVCARVGVPKGATAKLTIQKVGHEPNIQRIESKGTWNEYRAAEYYNSTASTQIKDICGPINMDGQYLAERIVGRLYSWGIKVGVESFYLKND